jgi:hypothetical protein
VQLQVAARAVFPDDGEIDRVPRGAALVGNGKLRSAHLPTILPLACIEWALCPQMLDKR